MWQTNAKKINQKHIKQILLSIAKIAILIFGFKCVKEERVLTTI